MKFEDFSHILKEDSTNGGMTLLPTNTTAAFVANKETTDAPKRLPYPLDTSFDLFADSFLKLRNLYEMLNIASQNKALPIGQKQKMLAYRDKIVTAAKTVKQVGILLDKEFGQ